MSPVMSTRSPCLAPTTSSRRQGSTRPAHCQHSLHHQHWQALHRLHNTCILYTDYLSSSSSSSWHNSIILWISICEFIFICEHNFCEVMNTWPLRNHSEDSSSCALFTVDNDTHFQLWRKSLVQTKPLLLRPRRNILPTQNFTWHPVRYFGRI